MMDMVTGWSLSAVYGVLPSEVAAQGCFVSRMHQGWSFGQSPHAHTSFPHLDSSAGASARTRWLMMVATLPAPTWLLDTLGSMYRAVASQAEGVNAKEGRCEPRKGHQQLGEGGSLRP